MVETATEAVDEPAEPTHMAWRKGTTIFLMVTLVMAELAAAFETSMIIAGMKRMLDEFGRPVTIGWVLTSYYLVASGSAALGGRLGDLFGRKRMLIVSLGLAVIGSLVSAFSPSLEGVIAGRGIQGLSGGILPLCFGIIRENMDRKQVPLAVGIITATASAGAGGGLVLGGLLVDYGHWSYIFFASAATALFALLAAPYAVPRSASSSKLSRGQDMFWGAMFIPPVAAILLAVSNFVSVGWDDLSVVRTFGTTRGVN